MLLTSTLLRYMTHRRRRFDIVYQRCDVASLPDWQELVDGTLREHGRIDIVHNNAYTATIKPTDELEEEDWDRQSTSVSSRSSVRQDMHLTPTRQSSIDRQHVIRSRDNRISELRGI